MSDNEVQLPDDDNARPAYIKTITDLRIHLQAAIELEHATIPPYLCGLYTIRAGKNIEAAEIIRTVVVQEMLHMVLVANIIIAIGGRPTIASPDFVPHYPTQLPIERAPIGSDALTVSLRKFSPEAIATFLAIEAPARPRPVSADFIAPRPVPVPAGQLKNMILNGELYHSIGDFYHAIETALRALERQARSEQDTIFTGDRTRQVGPEHYYDAGGRIFVVHDLSSALRALNVIVAQGEGRPGQTTDFSISAATPSNELAHYYRFLEIKHQQMYDPRQIYDPRDNQELPSGRTFTVEYGDDAVFDMVENPRIALFGDGDVADTARSFARTYTRFLRKLARAFNGHPDQLSDAVVQMFTLKQATLDLLNNPAPNNPPHCAGPCFEFVPLS